MNKEALKAIFDHQAASYDEQWEKRAPILGALFYLMEAQLSELPDEARVLCVGVGTGAEVAHLARRFPRWHFTALDPSGAMLDVCRERARAEGFIDRCTFHEGYLETLPEGAPHHAATCFLVSQFITDDAQRAAFFGAIADRLHPQGVLVSTDLCSGTRDDGLDALLYGWQILMSGPLASEEKRARMREAYTSDVAVRTAAQTAAIIEAGGFEAVTQFFQASLIHGWVARRAPRRG